jgi:hypothetical protein
VGALAAAGWTLAIRQGSQVTAGIGCYATANINGGVNVVDATGGSPIAACARQWRAGVVAGHVAQPPPLTACVLPRGGAVGVFPNTTCATLGLQTLPAHYASAAKTFVALTTQLAGEFGQPGDTTCIGAASALALVRSALRTHGYDDWTVSTTGLSAATPCASFAPDPEHHRIFVTGQQTTAFNHALASAVDAQRRSCAAGDAPERPATAIGLFHKYLQAAGYGSWTVTTDAVHTTREQPCYAASVNPAKHTVSLNSTMSMNPSP